VKKVYCIVVFAIVLLSCNKNNKEEAISLEPISFSKLERVEFKEPTKLVEFVQSEENGYIKNKLIGNINYSSILKPIDYMIAKKRIDENDPNLKASNFEDLQYFDLRIEVKDHNSEFIKYDLESPQQYEERVKYCSFEMQHDIKLIDGKDTLECVLFHFERAFNVVPYGHFILGFETKNKKVIEGKTLCFDDHLFNQGIIKFTYSPSLLVKQPVLL